MAAKKTRRTHTSRKKKQVTEDGRRILYKQPGFQAFAPNTKSIPKNTTGRKRKTVAYEPVTEPETGIHSLEWARGIVSQESGFLKLPLELRMRIYEFVIRDFGCGRMAIEPRKMGMGFKSIGWESADEDTSRLYLICRQIYVDTVGRGILYAQKLFFFASPNMMLNYLWVIHPVHLATLTSIELHITYSKSLALNSLPFQQLAKCTGLQRLYIQILVSDRSCTWTKTWTTATSSRSSRLRIWTYSLPERIWEKLTGWESIRALSGLDDFRLSIVPHPVHPDNVYCENESDPMLLREIEEGIRKMVCKGNARGEMELLEDRLCGSYKGVVVREMQDTEMGTGDSGVIDLT